jgi:hypothetical protein
MIAENLVNEINEPDNDTRISKEIILQMIVKAINDTADSDELVSRDVIIHNTEDCESRVLMIERSQR